MAEQTNAPLFSRDVFTGVVSGWNPVSAKICYLLLFREFQLHSGVTQITNPLCGIESAPVVQLALP